MSLYAFSVIKIWFLFLIKSSVKNCYKGFIKMHYSWIVISIVLISCNASNTKESSTPVSDACKTAKSLYGVCYFTCTGSTAGGFLYAANLCGKECTQEKREISRECR